MKAKVITKKTFLYPILIYVRYLFVRYILNLSFRNLIIKLGMKAQPVDNECVNFFGYYNIFPTNSKDEILYLKDRINGILAKHTGKKKKIIDEDTDRDNFMSPEEAVKYGLVDKVVKIS